MTLSQAIPAALPLDTAPTVDARPRRWAAPDARVHPEDASQEVLAVLATSCPPVANEAALRGWLWGVTWRTVRSHQRRAWVRRWVHGEDGDRWLEHAAGPSDTRDRDLAVKAVLGRLDARSRRLLWLAYAEGASRAELCDHLGWTEGTRARRLTAARRAFEREARRAGLEPGGSDG